MSSAARRFNVFIVLILVLTATATAIYLVHDQQQRTVLVVAAGARTSEGFRLMQAVATVVNKHYPDIQLDVIETAGSLDNARLIEAGHADLATLQADGSSISEGRLVASLYPDAYQLIARTNTNINSVADLRGKTVALPSKGSAQFTSFWYLANHYGLDDRAVTTLPMSSRSAEWALISNAVDAVFRVRAPGDATVKHLVERADITLVPIDQAPALHLRKSAIQSGTIPRGSYRGEPPLPVADLPTATVNRLLVAARSAQENALYDITSVLFERRRELTELNTLASLITPPDMAAGTNLPLHEGSARYYDREKPGFWSEQADLLRTLLSLAAIFASMTFAFRNWFQGRQKDRADAYNKDLISLYESASNGDHNQAYYSQELGKVLASVVDDLDNDRISREGFDEFSFTWQAVSTLIQDQQGGKPAEPHQASPS
jgi:TRAP transporter TAXI family solute receptor